MSTLTLQATRSWLILLTLTLLSVGAAYVSISPGILMMIVVTTVVIKGQQIVDIFMGLNDAPKRWRRLLLSYVLIVPTFIGLIFELL